jgi:TonB family protein
MNDFRTERLIEATSFLLTACVAFSLTFYAVGQTQQVVREAEKPAEIALALAAPPPPPPAPALVAPTPPAPAAPPLPAVAPTPLPIPRPPRHRAPHLAKPTTPAMPTQAEAPPRPDAPPAPKPQARPAENRSADALYTAQVHAVIERHKCNPRTPAYRMMHPHGTATVVFALTRNGTPSGARIVSSSGADMLDEQATMIVDNCRFPAMPPDAFTGAAAHDFQVEITFPPFGVD